MLGLGGLVKGLVKGAIGGLLGGGGAKRVQYHKMPTMDMIGDMVDSVTNTKMITTKGADGKITQNLVVLPRTKEEEEDYQNLKSTVRNVMGNLRVLLDKNPQNAERFESLITSLGGMSEERQKDLAQMMGGDIPVQERFREDLKEFKEYHTEKLDRDWRSAENKFEEKLIENGHLDSSAANEIRAHLESNRRLAKAEINMRADEYGRKIAQQDFDNRFSVYDAGRLQKQQDYADKEAARKHDMELGERMYGEAVKLSQEEVADQEKLLKHNQEAIDKEKAIQMSSIAPAMYQNAYNNEMGRVQGDNQVLGAQYAHDQARYNNSFKANFRKSMANQFGKATSGWDWGSKKRDDSGADEPINYKKYFNKPLGSFDFKV